MNRVDAQPNADETVRIPAPEETGADIYHGVELSPRTLESLVTWDVSGHAQRERDRLNAAHRIAPVEGRY